MGKGQKPRGASVKTQEKTPVRRSGRMARKIEVSCPPPANDIKLAVHVAPFYSPARRRLSTREFDFDSTQKAVFWPHFGVRFEFVGIKNQFVLSTLNHLSPFFALDR